MTALTLWISMLETDTVPHHRCNCSTALMFECEGKYDFSEHLSDIITFFVCVHSTEVGGEARSAFNNQTAQFNFHVKDYGD